MAEKKKKLGKGLDAIFGGDITTLISDIENNTPAFTQEKILLAEIRPNPYQPRKVFNEEAMKELASSIKEHGIFQPVILKRAIQGYEIVAGERRCRAAKMAGLEEVPAEFPLEKIYATHAVNGNGITKLVIVGQTSQGNATVPWATENGRIWADYSVEVAGCPWMNNPFIAYYGDMFYIFGGNMDAIYYSRNGLAWYETARNFLLPSSFAGNTNYAVVVEPTVDTAQKRDFIWVVLGGNGYNNEVWRGRLNRLGFLEP